LNFQDACPRPGGLKGRAICRFRGIAVLGVSTLVLKRLPSKSMCTSGTWKIPVRPEGKNKFTEEKNTGFFSGFFSFGKKSGIFSFGKLR
jgi:hypothetical protein